MSRLFLAVFICLVVYPAQAQSVTATVTVGVSPFAIAVNPVSNKIYVAGSGSNNVTLINGADNSTATVSVGTTPVAVAVNPVTNKIYVANNGSNNVTVINGADNSTTTVAVPRPAMIRFRAGKVQRRGGAAGGSSATMAPVSLTWR